MGIFDESPQELLQVNCPKCRYSGQMVSAVADASCPACGNTAIHVCYADEDSLRNGI